MDYYDKAKDCKMFMSRKPCPMCAKLLVQSKVKRVLYLPLEPEYYRSPEAETQMKQVDKLFTASAIAQTRFIPLVEESVLKKAKDKTPTDEDRNVDEYKTYLMKKYIFDEDDASSTWLNNIQEKLPWPEFDNEMKDQVKTYFEEFMEWIARVYIFSGAKDVKDEAKDARGRYFKFSRLPQNNPTDVPPFDPTSTESTLHTEQATCLIGMARFLAQRTDDPKTGVGAVIVSYPEMEIISIGWNGFPFEAPYGEFARASKSDKNAYEKKYAYVIHAEQNALMMRNNKNIKDAILFTTKSPCDECAPLIAMKGIKTVVVDADVKRVETDDKNALGYNMFLDMLEDHKFTCYQTKRCGQGQPISDDKKRGLSFDSSQQQKLPKTK